MFLIDITPHNHNCYDPIVNQSIDNYLINDLKLPGHGLICYINRPSVIIGSAQNAFSEVDLNYLEQNNVSLVRRTSGGGAVYHDEGNIIFENIISGSFDHCSDYNYFAEPILSALEEMGLQGGHVSAKSALVANDHKFSGMCMIKGKDGYAAGGTLMFDMNIANARLALTPKKRDQVKRGVLSADRPITNLKPLLPNKYASMSAEAFKNELLLHLFHVKHMEDIPTYHLTQKDWKNIFKLIDQKYGKDVWNYGKNPGYEYYSNLQLKNGQLHVNFSTENQQISRIKFFGSTITVDAAEALEEVLLGTDLNDKTLDTLLSRTIFGSNKSFVQIITEMLLAPEKTHQIIG